MHMFEFQIIIIFKMMDSMHTKYHSFLYRITSYGAESHLQTYTVKYYLAQKQANKKPKYTRQTITCHLRITQGS